MNKTLIFLTFPANKPTDGFDCLDFILLFAGRQWKLAKWGAERQMFFTESGDYIEDPYFQWAKL